MAKRPVGIVLLTVYEAAIAMGGVAIAVVFASALTLDYVNGFIMVIGMMGIILFPIAGLSGLAAYGAWTGRRWALLLIRCITVVKVLLSIFPLSVMLGIGVITFWLEAAVLIYVFTKVPRLYFRGHPAETAAAA